MNSRISVAIVAMALVLGSSVIQPCVSFGQELPETAVNEYKDALAENLRALSQEYKNWKLFGDPMSSTPEQKQKLVERINQYAEKIIDQVSAKNYPFINGTKLANLQSKVFAEFMLEADRVLFPKDWCELYRKYRLGAGAQFEVVKDNYWDPVDKIYKAQCREKGEKKAGAQTGQQSAVFGQCKEGESIYACAKAQPLKFELVGNGKDTNEAALIVTNEKTGAVGVELLDFVCASTKDMLPPPPRNIVEQLHLTYVLTVPDPKHISILRGLAGANPVSIGLEGPIKDRHELAQLLIWQHEGKKTPKKSDDIDRKYFEDKLQKQLGHKFDQAEKVAAEDRIDKALAQLDFFSKESEELIAKDPKQLDPSGAIPADFDDAIVGEPRPRGTIPASAPNPVGDSSVEPALDEGTVADPKLEKTVAQDATMEECSLICVPAGTTFKPSDPSHQYMTATESAVVHMMPGFGAIKGTVVAGGTRRHLVSESDDDLVLNTGTPAKLATSVPGLNPGAGGVLANVTPAKVLFPFYDEKTKKYGFKDKEGNIVLTPQYEEAGQFADSVAPVKLQGLWFLINVLGEKKSEGFEKMGAVSDGLVAVMRRTKINPTETVESWGYINTSGGKVIPIGAYQEADDFKNGVARVRTDSGWGLIDTTGREIVKPRFERIGTPSSGVALVVKGGKFGFVDLKNNVVVAPIYDDAQPFVLDRSIVKLNGKFGIIDPSGRVIVKPEYDSIEGFRLRAGSPTTIIEKDGKRQLIDTDGKASSSSY